MIIVEMKKTWEQLRDAALPRVWFSINALWWTMEPADIHQSELLEMDAIQFLGSAEKHPEAFGKHGLRALAATYHGNIIVAETGLPTSVVTWEMVNALLDQSDGLDRLLKAVMG